MSFFRLNFSFLVWWRVWAEKKLKKIWSPPPLGGGFVGNCSILAHLKITFRALVTIYFKIEKTLENKKVLPWWDLSGVCPQIWATTSNLGSRAQKLVFTSIYYIADIDESWFGFGPFLVPSWHPKTESRVLNVCWEANYASWTQTSWKSIILGRKHRGGTKCPPRLSHGIYMPPLLGLKGFIVR